MVRTRGQIRRFRNSLTHNWFYKKSKERLASRHRRLACLLIDQWLEIKRLYRTADLLLEHYNEMAERQMVFEDCLKFFPDRFNPNFIYLYPFVRDLFWEKPICRKSLYLDSFESLSKHSYTN